MSQPKRAWPFSRRAAVIAIVLASVTILLVGIVAVSDKVRAQAIETDTRVTETLYQDLISGREGHISPDALTSLKDAEARHGKLKKVILKRAYADQFATAVNIEVTATRERAVTTELLVFSRGGAVSHSIVDVAILAPP